MVLWFNNHSLSLIILTYLIRIMTLALIVKKNHRFATFSMQMQ